MAIFEGVCERIFGSTFTLQSYSEYLDFFPQAAAVLFRGSLTFFMPLSTRGPLLAHLRMLALPPGLSGQCLQCPLLLPLACSPCGGPKAGLGCSHCYGRLSTAPRHLPPSEALCTGSGASRRRPTFVAASGSSGARAQPPAGGGPIGRSLSRRAGRGFCGRRSGRFQCPREPLSKPGWGSWLVGRCFPALLFNVGLQLPVFSLVPSLVSDLACLVCTFQIKVCQNLRAVRGTRGPNQSLTRLAG